MVKKWEKNLRLIEKVLDIDLDAILEDIYGDNFEGYDVKKLIGHKNLYRIRIGKYRIIFEKGEKGNIIRDIGARGSIYKRF